MQDNEFLSQFEKCTLPKEYFKHINHIRIAWLYLSRYPEEEAYTRIIQGIIRYATHLGAANIYNETLTQAWIRLVQRALKTEEKDFDTFIRHNGHLLNKDFLLQYYSSDLLHSEKAKKEWIEPDLKPLDD